MFLRTSQRLVAGAAAPLTIAAYVASQTASVGAGLVLPPVFLLQGLLAAWPGNAGEHRPSLQMRRPDGAVLDNAAQKAENEAMSNDPDPLSLLGVFLQAFRDAWPPVLEELDLLTAEFQDPEMLFVYPEQLPASQVAKVEEWIRAFGLPRYYDPWIRWFALLTLEAWQRGHPQDLWHFEHADLGNPVQTRSLRFPVFVAPEPGPGEAFEEWLVRLDSQWDTVRSDLIARRAIALPSLEERHPDAVADVRTLAVRNAHASTWEGLQGYLQALEPETASAARLASLADDDIPMLKRRAAKARTHLRELKRVRPRR